MFRIMNLIETLINMSLFKSIEVERVDIQKIRDEFTYYYKADIFVTTDEQEIVYTINEFGKGGITSIKYTSKEYITEE